jgi:hypothetical protein
LIYPAASAACANETKPEALNIIANISNNAVIILNFFISVPPDYRITPLYITAFVKISPPK